MDSMWSVIVTLTCRDALTRGYIHCVRVAVRGQYADCQSYSDIQGYSDMGVHTLCEGGSTDSTRTVRVTLTYRNTLTSGYIHCLRVAV